jgi:CheY-specific phosphatase CheX
MSTYDDLLSQVGEEIFENPAFMLPGPAAGPTETTAMSAARVGFTGPFGGSVRLRLPSAMLEELASNMLGLEAGQPVPLDQQADALRELLNVICGNLLPRLAGTEAVFDVGTAETLPAGYDAAAGEVSCAKASVPFDAGNVELELIVPGGVPVSCCHADPTAVSQ